MMGKIQAVEVRDVEAIEQSIGRGGTIVAKTFPLDTGVANVRMEFTWIWTSAGYCTPRHMHAFDQIRYVLGGEFTSEVGTIKEGEIGYFPEGVSYGPQDFKTDNTGLILQFPGPSGIEYFTHFELDAARRKLIEEGGTFDKGVYTKHLSDGRKINADSHKACWEAVSGRKLVFPKGRFAEPVVMSPDVCRWIPDPKLKGVERKHLGTFAEMKTGVEFIKLAPGARLLAQHNIHAEIRYLVDGSVSYGGKVWTGGTTRDRGAYFYIPHDTDVDEFSTDGGAVFLSISLPMVGILAAEATEAIKAA